MQPKNLYQIRQQTMNGDIGDYRLVIARINLIMEKGSDIIQYVFSSNPNYYQMKYSK